MGQPTSRAAIVSGLLAIVLLSLAIFGGSWLNCKERAVINSNTVTTVTFRMGLWKVCPLNPSDDDSENYVFKDQPTCITISYKYWALENFNHLDIWLSLQFTPQFVTRMRVCTPFACIGLGLLGIATICCVIGHCKNNNSMLLACGLFILAGILIGSGLLVFASILSDSYYEGLNGNNISSVSYTYGWGFFYAAAALAMSMLAIVFSITSHMYKYGSVEDMVLAMVPGADRRLRQQIVGERFARGLVVVTRRPQIVAPLASFKDLENKIPDLCEAENSGEVAVASIENEIEEIAPIAPMPRPAARFKTLSGREPRYAAPPRPPARFHSLPRRAPEPQPGPAHVTFCTKSAV